MNRLEKWLPVAFALPFLFATTMLEFLRLPSEFGRWLMLATTCGLAAMHGFGRGPKQRLGMLPADGVFLAFLGFFGISSIWAIDFSYSLQRTISFGMLYGATFWYGWGYADRFGEDRLLRLLLRTSAVLLGLNLLVFGVLAPDMIVARRFHGFFENPNNIGLICSVSLPLAFVALLRKREVGNWVEFSVFFLSVLACGSRTGLVASMTGMALIGGLRMIRGDRLALAFGVALAVLVASVSLTSYFEENVARADTLETMSNRTFFWELAKEDYIPERPWLGHGFGTDGLIHEHYGVSLFDLKLRGYGVMSSYYGLAVAVGIPVTVLFYVMMGAVTLWALWQYWKDPLQVALCAAVIAGMLVGITESAIYSVGNCFAYLFWMAFALMIRRANYRALRVRMTKAGAVMNRPRKKRARGRRKSVQAAGSERRPTTPPAI